jgi:hypothetical protein
MSASAISTTAATVTSFLGNGAIGAWAGTNTVSAITALGAANPVIAGVTGVIIVGGLFFVRKKEENIQAKMRLPRIQKPIFIEIEPKITAPSLIDDRVIVSKFTWAVTLVSNEGKTIVGGKPSEIFYGNHAEIYIEGINDGFYDSASPLLYAAIPIGIGEKFLHLAHYTPKIEFGLFSPDDFKYEKRTEIWMISSKKVKQMLRNIEVEKTPINGKHHHIYNMYGKDAYGHKLYGENGHNCFTWAGSHLKSIGIELKGKQMPPSLTGLVAVLVKDYTKKPEEYKEIPIIRI